MKSRDFLGIWQKNCTELKSYSTFLLNYAKKISIILLPGVFLLVLFFERLAYFDDVKIVKIDFFDKVYIPKQIQDFLKQEIRKYLEDFKKS